MARRNGSGKVALLTLLLLGALTGCFRKVAPLSLDELEDARETDSGAYKPSASAGSKPLGERGDYEDFPEFKEGGTMTLEALGQTATVELTDVVYANTGSDYPDFLEIQGPGTSLFVTNAAKMDDNAYGHPDYASIANVALPIEIRDPDDALIITMDPLGQYPVNSGTLTLEKFDWGREGHDWWEGRIRLMVQTSAGEIAVNGTFKMCVVPVW